VVSAGWDGMANCWDLRVGSSAPVHSINFGERIWSMDATWASHPAPMLAMVGPREMVMLYDLRAARAIMKTTPLKLQVSALLSPLPWCACVC